jgi:DNA-binding GntR family transcriptional regulator
MPRPTTLRPIERSASLAEQVYVTLRERLRSGAMSWDEPLREVALAAQLGVSRTPIREALARLASEGLIRVGGRSFAVPALSEEDIEEIYELRVLLETEAIRQAAMSAPPGRDRSLVAIRHALRAAEAAHGAGDAKRFVTANREFRGAWLALVTNRRLVQAVELYADHVRALQRSTLGVPARQRVVIAGMKAMHDAVQARDGEAASRSMRHYLGVARDAMREVAGLRAQARSAAA